MTRGMAAASVTAFIVFILGFLPLEGQYDATSSGDDKPIANPAVTRLRNRLNPEFTPWELDYVIDRAAEFLATVPEPYRCNIRIFDASSVPRAMLPAATSSLYFGANQASRASITYRPRPIPHTDNRMFWIDLIELDWTPQAWAKVSREDPYFREPLITSNSPGLMFLRKYGAHDIMRADWWVYYTFDNAEFLDAGKDQVKDTFMYTLLYSNASFKRIKKKATASHGTPYGKPNKKAAEDEFEIVRGVAPETVDEFESAWNVDFNVLKDFPIDKGAVIDEGNSRDVAYHNRVIWRVRGSVGVYYRTFDVFRSVGRQDYIENPFPTDKFVGEHIFQLEKGSQYYFLSNLEAKRVELGDVRVVRHSSGRIPAVIMTHSCISCHDNGIIGFRNDLPEALKNGMKLRLPTIDEAIRVEQFFLQDHRLQKFVKADQDNYASFIKDANGLTPQENAASFSQFRAWYWQPVTLEQAARECGVGPKDLADALGGYLPKPHYKKPGSTAKGRLGRLILDGTPIPRAVWERGLFQEAHLLLQNYRRHAKLYFH